MEVISRRTVLGLATIGLLPSWQKSSSGQGVVAVGKVIIEVAGAILTAVGVVDLIKKWTTDARCDVSVPALEQLLLQCELMDRKLNQGGTGILSLLTAYGKLPTARSSQSWDELRFELAAFLDLAAQFLQAVDVLIQGTFKKFAAEKDLSAARTALRSVRAALTALAGRPKPPTEAELKELLPQLQELATATKRSVASMKSAVDQRDKMQC